MDEYGSAIKHNDDPVLKCSPFFYAVTNEAMTLMWPLRKIKPKSYCTRNFIPQIMANETLNICKARLHAFDTELQQKHNPIQKSDKAEKVKENVDNISCSVESVTGTCSVGKDTLVYFSNPDKSVVQELFACSVTDTKSYAKVCVLSLNDAKLKIDSEPLPASEVLANQKYLKLFFDINKEQVTFFDDSFFLPEELAEFHDDFTFRQSASYWLCRPVDARHNDFKPFVSSQYPRIARVCETGPVLVSRCKYTLMETLYLGLSP